MLANMSSIGALGIGIYKGSYVSSNKTLHSANDDSDSSLTITLSQKDIRAAARLLKVLGSADDEIADLQLTGSTGAPMTAPDHEILVCRARQTMVDRRRRAQIFGQSMSGPAWDMLLALYIAQVSEGRMTLGKLASRSGGAESTARRWMDYLLHRNLVARKPHPTDLRVVFIELTEKGRAAMDMYLSGTFDARV